MTPAMLMLILQGQSQSLSSTILSAFAVIGSHVEPQLVLLVNQSCFCSQHVGIVQIRQHSSWHTLHLERLTDIAHSLYHVKRVALISGIVQNVISIAIGHIGHILAQQQFHHPVV